jgi:hypothetical protein
MLRLSVQDKVTLSEVGDSPSAATLRRGVFPGF